MKGGGIGLAAALFAAVAGVIVVTWAWLGMPVEMPQASVGLGEKLHCISYAPFRGEQNPFGPDVPIDVRQIDEDLAQLKQVTNCIRTYSIDHGLDQIPEVARRHGLKVMQGLWLSSLPDLSRNQVEGAVALAKRYPDVITAVIVGNEVLLRGEMSAPQLARTIREVKAQVTVAVTYADVWEFWLRYREVAAAVDFVTVHILPYWEDFPIPVANAAQHVDAIRQQIAAAFPDKEVLIGEFGWPSAGRMREGARPSPADQARVLHDVLALAKRQSYRVNVIEAYDQPWKRQLEGTVGGHWGLFDGSRRALKFEWGAAVSNHPAWRWQAAGGVGLAALVFAAALAAGARRPRELRTPAMQTLTMQTLTIQAWLAIAASAAASGTMIGWAIASIPLESLTVGDWMRSLAWGAVAIAAPVLCAMAVAGGVEVPSFARVLGRRADRVEGWLAILLGLILVALTLLAVQAALGLVFDPRYRDFPFPALMAAAIPFLARKTSWPRLRSLQPCAETVAAATLALSAVYIVFNETLANWQALWFAAGLLVLAVSLLPERGAPDSK
jgi:exo-beta-1,3-glucanase (GH17 family)